MAVVELHPINPANRNDSSVTNTAEAIKASGGIILGGNAYNPSAALVAYIQFFNIAAADVVLGTTVPVYTVAVPPLTSVPFVPPRPVVCATAISYAVTATMLGSGAPGSALTVYTQYF